MYRFSAEKTIYNKLNNIAKKIGVDLDKYIGNYVARILLSLGFNLRKNNDDRYVLENVIFPYFIENAQYRRVLFVGCAWYTKIYEKLFRDKEYWTIEIDPCQKKFGSKNHIIDSIENICQYFQPESLDLIICNGVFGWGVSTKPVAEATFQGCFKSLREDGVMVIGWDDTPPHNPFPLVECQSINQFTSFVFPPLGTAEYHVSNNIKHVFSFYNK
ncbi:MAG: hypothetical protein OEV64_11590 [Desulfobulbaceae bacterium]|nr:hypothetical protein [Desulfobulbaceae bacterium]